MSTILEVHERAALPHHRWSVDDYHQMAQTGLLRLATLAPLADSSLKCNSVMTRV
jgi:hypothetical protein